MKLKLNEWDFAPEFIPLLHDTNTTKILYGSRNSTKSDVACFLKLKRCLTLPYFKCLMARKFKDTVKGSIYDTLKKVAKRYKIDHLFEFKENPLRIICTLNNNEFVALGLYEHGVLGGNAKSISDPTDALVDELDQCTENEYDDLLFSLRGSDDIEIIGIFNTNQVDENHWIYKRWFPPLETFEKKNGKHSYIKSIRSNTTIMHSTHEMNPFVPELIKKEFEEQKKHSPERYDVTGLGLIKSIRQSNIALSYYDRFTHVSDKAKFRKDALIYLTWDFNRLPHHTVGMWQFGGSDDSYYYWDLVNEFCLPDKSVTQVTTEIAKWIKGKEYETKRIVIVCDYSGNTKKDHDTKDFISKIKLELKNHSFEVTDNTVTNPSVVTSLDFLNDMFAGYVKVSKQNDKHAGKIIKLRINPTCSYHIADFEKTKTDADGTILKQTASDVFIEDGVKVKRTYQVRGHAVDGSRYMAVTVFKSEYLNRNKP